ncbi:hypothetical protein DL89DRAFT_118853 [Linderina pennispora]|uniref:Uncharacterized protein n=1 Tax=Linderina pennispora TaxID=61395 RepID=A0A1Y1VVH0_9FUNG|nr:uncharacterized protein DL89DRAFT_118853 [Linderina pennispora]ORX65291.1 hypothetical protein DL89DRAFT_118853 [Linderina pennispora]
MYSCRGEVVAICHQDQFQRQPAVSWLVGSEQELSINVSDGQRQCLTAPNKPVYFGSNYSFYEDSLLSSGSCNKD